MSLDIQKVLEELPSLLRQNPELRYQLFVILSDNFVTRHETQAILEELREIRKENARQFVEINKRFEALQAEMDRRFEALQREMDERFGKVDERFAKIDERFEKIDERFENIDERFEKIDERFARIDERFEKIDERFARIDERLEKMDERFAEIDKRLENIDERFATIDERFAKVDGRIDALHHEMEERFARVDERFVALHQEMEKRFEKVDQEFRGLREEVRDIRKSVDLQVGRFQTRAGRNLEDLVAATLRVALSDRTIREETIRLRQKFVDREGLVRPKGREVECDIMVEDTRVLVFEIKAYAKVGDVTDLYDKVTLVKTYYPEKEVLGVLVAMGYDPEVEEACTRYGIVFAK